MHLNNYIVGRKKEYPLIEQLEIIDIAAEGKAIGKKNGIVVIVPQAIPGDVVDVQVIRKRKKFMEGIVVKHHVCSEHRTSPFCEHFGTCGGCKWQNLSYPDQLKYKQKQVTDNLERIAKVEIPEVQPIIPSDNTEFYRNKLEFSFSENRWLSKEEVKSNVEISNRFALGFHIPGRFDRVLDINHCYLQAEPSDKIRLAIKKFALANKYRFFDQVRQEGFLRTLIIRNTLKGEVMVILSFFRYNKNKIDSLLAHINSSFPQITSLMYVINPKGNDSLDNLEVILHSGRDHIIEEMDTLRFRIGPKSFFQTNPGQAVKLYRIVREFAGLSGTETVYDLYTGTGTIALFMAGYCNKVIGIEYIREATEDAVKNAVMNSIGNVSFFDGDIKELINERFIEKNGRPDVMIIDPPRAGMHGEVVDRILNIQPGRIVYVSCNPATQARDILLMSGRYKVMKVQPVDMFPHTHHVENVVLLETYQGKPGNK